MELKHWIGAFRPKTLPAAAAPIVVGTAMAVGNNAVHWLSAVLALVSALLIQIGTNLFNDYADFVKGADTEARTGPVRVTQAGLIHPSRVKLAAVLSFALSAVAGGYLMIRGGWPIVIIGVLSILCGFLYTAGKHSLAYTGLADLFVLIFFGPVAVAGTYFVQALTVSRVEIMAGLGPGMLATAILLVNNIRDVNEDRLADKKTLIVRTNRRVGHVLYGAAIVGTGLLSVWLSFSSPGHANIWIAGLIVLPGLYLLKQLVEADKSENTEGARYNRLLASTAKLLLVYSIVFAVVWNI